MLCSDKQFIRETTFINQSTINKTVTDQTYDDLNESYPYGSFVDLDDE